MSGNCMRNCKAPTESRRCGGSGGRKMAWLRCRWAVAGPGRASRRHITTQHRRRHWCGGCRRVRRARAGFEIDHSEPQARVWRSRGRPGPTAPRTPAAPQATSSIANSGCAAGTDGSRAGRRPRAHRAARPTAGSDGARNTSGATSTTERRSLRTPRSTPGSGRPGGRRGGRAH